MDDDEGPFGSAPEPTPQPIPWESGPGGVLRRFFATQVALLAPSTLVKAFGEGSTLTALRYAVITAFLAGALRIPEWTHTLHFDNVIRVFAKGKPFVTVAGDVDAVSIALDVLRAWGLGIGVYVVSVAALAASYASLGLSFEESTRADDGAARRREALLRAAFYLTTSILLVLALRLAVVLVVGVRDRWIIDLLMIPAILVMLRGLRATAVDQCKLTGGGAIAVTIVPVVLLLATQMVLVDRLLAPLLPRVATAEELEDAERALQTLTPRRRSRDAGSADAASSDGGAADGASVSPIGAPRDGSAPPASDAGEGEAVDAGAAPEDGAAAPEVP
ncbi:MAG: hypothetical protein IT379_31195, partial [Deltaproteobacteria bacterium]|nr:hypothetical protein [Deltaproteobacteria bacterium]